MRMQRFRRHYAEPKAFAYLRTKPFAVLLVAGLALCGTGAFAQNSQPPGEQPKQLAQPNGPPQPDPNQKPQAASATSASGLASIAHDAQNPAPANWALPLSRNAGTWVVHPEHGGHLQIQTDTCQTSGTRFYLCEHVVDGETIALLIFVPGDEPGHFYVQSVLPSGTALGRGDLAITGDTWVFTSKTQRENGSINYQRVTRVFSGHDSDTVHFQMERSDDGLHWVTTSTGVERRKK